MKEQEIGFISKYFGKINVGTIDLTSEKLTTGDTIHIQDRADRGKDVFQDQCTDDDQIICLFHL